MRTPSIISCPSVEPLPLGHKTTTSYPSLWSEQASFHTRVSNGTGWFSTTIRIFFFMGNESFYLEQLVESGESAHHRCLPPVERRGLVDQPLRIAAVVKITGAILHICDRPLRDLDRQGQALGIPIVKEHEGIDRLRATLNVQGHGLVIVVSRCSVRKKERRLPPFVSIHQLLIETVIARALLVIFKAVENVGGVKVIDPVMICRLGIVPG